MKLLDVKLDTRFNIRALPFGPRFPCDTGTKARYLYRSTLYLDKMEALGARQFAEAARAFTEALAALPAVRRKKAAFACCPLTCLCAQSQEHARCVTLMNRAKCWLEVGAFPACVQDSRQAMEVRSPRAASAWPRRVAPSCFPTVQEPERRAARRGPLCIGP